MMGDETKTTTGGCMCGAVRYEAVGEPLGVGHCHCSSCRRHTGAPVVTFVAFDAQQVRFPKGERRIYNSSPGVGRAFCDQCGTPLTWEGHTALWDTSIIEFHISTLDDPEAFAPNLHWFHSERIAWFDVADDLPRYRELDDGAEPYQRGPAIAGPSSGS
jgi:hypothetical protein